MTIANRIALLAALASGGLLLVSCSEGNGRGEDAAAEAAGPDANASAQALEVAGDVYADILGIVQSLPVAGNPASEMRIYHEQIPGFKTQEGTVFVAADGVRGMKSMTMAFPVAEGLDISTLSIGDKIRFDFVVTWDGSPPWSITRFEKIDPATEIDFSNKTPEDAEQP
jgi:hypothetical protein